MRISFDLDDTLICRQPGAKCEPRLPWPLRVLVGDEPLRSGARDLIGRLARDGHEVWVYTSSHRRPRAVRLWLRVHGVKVARVINGTEHERCFGVGSTPSKRPHAFQIDLHVDNSVGVAKEGEQYGFRVCVVHPDDELWAKTVLDAVRVQVAAASANAE